MISRIIALMLLLVSIALGAFPWTAAPADDAQKQRESELTLLRNTLQNARDSLQNEIAQRYTLKQHGIEQRETDKEELERLREQQERTFNDLSRLKEECLARQQSLEDERKTTVVQQESWGAVKEAMSELLNKETDRSAEAFPADREAALQNNKRLEQMWQRNNDPAPFWNALVAQRLKSFLNGDTISIIKQTLVPDNGGAQNLTIVRLGSVAGYGMNEQGALYVIRQTGALGAGRFALDSVQSPQLTQFLQQMFPAWLASSRVSGPVLCDVMQNDFTKTLITGRKSSRWTALAKWFKNGGPVMYPLVLVTLWALLLWIIKMFDYGREREHGARLNRQILSHLAQSKPDDARSALKGAKGTFARIARFCLDNTGNSRETSERVIKEILIGESPRFNRHINTLAVLATAAPLLGLLGTVTGMINLFAVLTEYGNSDPKLVAGGISEALVTTQTGMMIAIPIVLIHNHLRNRKNLIQAEIDKYTIALLNRLWP